MRLVVGLGNPGPKYARNRHNVGFMAAERLAERLSAGAFREKFKGAYAKVEHASGEVIVLKPLTYMNLSGESVQPAMRFFKVPVDDLIVLHDELDHDFGVVRIKVGGGTAGHNGLRSIVQHAGSPDFIRIRIGIGRPPSGTVEGYVLSDFGASERAEVPDVVERACDAVLAVLSDGAKLAMNAFNQRAG
jgi:PTH1 family peptidyl-tRNA hydrolase